MKQLYFLFCFLFCELSNAQVINFPDASFKTKLLQPNVAFATNGDPIVLDANNNNEIEMSETAGVERLVVSNAGISDLTGISYFSDLKFLNCNNNALTTIAIDGSISLMALSANHNMLSSMSVNFDASNEGLDLSYNNLTSFVVEDTYFWETFNLSHNQLTSLTLSNSLFTYFDIDNNNLSTIQFDGNINFAWPFASFKNNQFTLLEFPGNVQFANDCTIFLGGNTLDNVYFHNFNQPGNIAYSSANNTSFDLGNFHMTKSCDPENEGNVTISSGPNLQEIIFKNGFNHTTITCDEGGNIFQNPALYLTIGNCPNLSHICVDEAEQPYFQTRINQLGLQSQVSISNECDSLVLGTAEAASGGLLTIFPVPVKDILQIQSADVQEVIAVEIYSNLGQLVQREVGSGQSIDVSPLSKGSYYLKIYDKGNTTLVKPFLKG